jgi:S-adenosylmethionine:tRNA-ribosyltransferase-isomerase (queuine synthetase)
MKRRKVTSRPLSLGDLILAVSSYSETQEETVATVADLLASGQVSIMNNGRKIRARVR